MPVEKLPVFDPVSGKVILLVDEFRARELIKAGEAFYLRTKKRISGLQIIAREAKPKEPVKPTCIRRRGTTGDSHKSERADNPAGVWTIDRVKRRNRGIFLKVVSDCRVLPNAA